MNQTRWAMRAILYAVRTVMSFQFQTVGPTASMLSASLGTDNAQLGPLIGLYLLPGLPLALLLVTAFLLAQRKRSAEVPA